MSTVKPAAKRRRVGGIIVKVALGLFSVGLTLVAADLALRLFSVGAPRRGVLDPKPDRHALTSWIDVFQPGYSGTLVSRDFKVHLRMNSLGLRERELDLEVLAAQRPFLFLGDSYFFGWGVEADDRVSERFAALARQEDPSASVVNLSFPGWGTYHYVEVWEHFVPRLHPRLVIVSCFVGNDFTDDLKQASRRQSQGGSPEAPEPSRVGWLYRPGLAVREALSTSPLVGLVNNLLWKSPRYRSLFSRMEIRNDRVALYQAERSDLQQQLYASTKSALATIGRLSRESGIPVLVVLIPDHLQVLMPGLFQDLDLDRPQREIKEHLERQGIACLDLLPSFQAAAAPGNYFFREDKHWNARGHEFIAEQLLPAVRELLRHRLDADPDRRSEPGPAPASSVPTNEPGSSVRTVGPPA